MAPKLPLFTKWSKLPLNQGFQNRILVITVSRQALEIEIERMEGCTDQHKHPKLCDYNLTQKPYHEYTCLIVFGPFPNTTFLQQTTLKASRQRLLKSL